MLTHACVCVCVCRTSQFKWKWSQVQFSLLKEFFLLNIPMDEKRHTKWIRPRLDLILDIESYKLLNQFND